MSSTELRIGYHVSLGPSLYETVSYPNTLTTQFYMGSNRTFNIRDITPHDWNNTYNYCTTSNVSFHVHTSLLCNLAHSTKQYIVDGTMTVLQKQIDMLVNLPGDAVLHIGKCGTMSNVINNANNLRIGTSNFGPTLLFENAAGQGTELGKSFDELRLLFEGLDSVEGKIGLCLDTQHMYGAGMCKFDTRESVVRMFDDAESVVGTGVTLFHLNDSKVHYHSNVDRHMSLGRGYIWGDINQPESIEAFDYLLRRCRSESIDMVGETGDASNDMPIIYSRLQNMDFSSRINIS